MIEIYIWVLTNKEDPTNTFLPATLNAIKPHPVESISSAEFIVLYFL